MHCTTYYNIIQYPTSPVQPYLSPKKTLREAKLVCYSTEMLFLLPTCFPSRPAFIYGAPAHAGIVADKQNKSVYSF